MLKIKHTTEIEKKDQEITELAKEKALIADQYARLRQKLREANVRVDSAER